MGETGTERQEQMQSVWADRRTYRADEGSLFVYQVIVAPDDIQIIGSKVRI